MQKWISFLVLACYLSSSAQSDISGIWQGHINAGVSLLLAFHIQKDHDTLKASMDVPDQGLKNMPASRVRAAADSVTLRFDNIGGLFSGKKENDSTIAGTWIQAGMHYPLQLMKVGSVTVARRPQTPVPPFPYKSEDVVYQNGNNTIRYGATLTIPNGRGPFPAVLLITGSGQQNRDEEMMQHKPFAVIADYLTRRGYVVMRVDDRGMGQSTGDVKSATSRDFANDVEVSMGYLAGREEADRKKIGLLGHSEGGMIAQIVGAERSDIDFLVFLAAPGEKISELMASQNAAILSSIGIGKSYVDLYMPLFRSLQEAIPDAPTEAAARDTASKLVSAWLASTPRNVAIVTSGIKDDKSQQEFVNRIVTVMHLPWYRYFIHYDPDPNLRKIHAKVLALNGSRDIQVIASGNLSAMEASLKRGSAREYEIKQLDGLNHLFQQCKLCTLQEYGQLEETISPEVLQTIGDWLDKEVKNEKHRQ